MKRIDIKKIIWFVITVFYIAIVAYVLFKLCYLTVKSYDPLNNQSDIIKNVTSIFTCLTASISLFLTIKFKYDSYKEKKIDKKREIDYYWFKALIADKFMERIFTFFNTCNILVDKLKETNDRNVKANWPHNTYLRKIKEDVIQPFTKEYTGLQQELILSTEIIDENLAEAIQTDFQNFQDEFLKYTDNMNPDYNQCKIMISDFQKKVISNLKTYNSKIYD